MKECVKVIKVNGKIKVTSPFHSELPSRARALGGKFDKSSKEWVFNEKAYDEVKVVYEEIYGEFDAPVEKVDVKIRLKDSIAAEQKSIYICGVQIARAFDRDGGAKTSENCVLNDCCATSGGSRKNWTTVIAITGEDPYIKIFDIPVKSIEKEVEKENEYEIEILSTPYEEEALIKEKESLLNRIHEIDKMLKS